MNKKTARLIAIVIIIAMVITSFSFVTMGAYRLLGGSGMVVYGASVETSDIPPAAATAAVTTDRELEQQMEMLARYIQGLKKNYKDTVDYQKMIDGAFSGATQALGDPYTVYYLSDEEGNSFVEMVNGEFSGVGITMEEDPLGARVVSTVLSGPAEKAGIRAGDIVVQVGDIPVAGMSLEKIRKLLRGPVSTVVAIKVRRGSEEKSFSVIREMVKLASVSRELLQGNIGVIRITSFDNDTGSEFEVALRELIGQGADRIIIDLRNNGGGLVGSAFDVANTMIRQGIIVRLSQQGQEKEVMRATVSANYNLPTVVLVNENTASASEILAGALQDHKKAVLVGKTTFGKGIAQTVEVVNTGHQVKYSAYYFTTPLGRVIHGQGIVPDHMADRYEGKGAETEALYEAVAPMSEAVKYGPGATGLNVYGAQQRLALMGYRATPSGLMDGDTVEAVKKFQRSEGLYAYGVLDLTTRDRLSLACHRYVYGTADLQMEKALELLK